MKDEVREFAARLKPPPSDADPTTVMAWRWFVAIVTGVNTLSIATHILLACGFVPAVYPGFAKATETTSITAQVASIKDDLKASRVKALPALLLDAKQKQCAASGDAKRLYFNAYNDLRAEYYELTHREFPDPSCSDFS